MPFKVNFSASNFVSSIVGEATSAIKGAIGNTISQKLGSLGPLGKLAANFINETGGFGSSINNRTISRAVISDSIYNSTTAPGDWRVSLTVPDIILDQGDILAPLRSDNGSGVWNTGNKMVFPFNPTVLLSHSANYSQVQPTHTNYAYNAYESSQVDAITITGEFYQENENDAKYWIACLHFLRSATKMFYGESTPLGNPPVVCRLNGYGKHVLNNMPVVITNFTTDLPVDVDYIQCKINGLPNYVPTQSAITVTLQPQYARRSQSGFSLNQYAAGGHIGGDEGFV
jgi:hypothetical protein|tara:strand:+ start:628 stop:1485 length:858 start_codon:yes stop_codon:yes gene_type:complete